jgi:hypothetical protein
VNYEWYRQFVPSGKVDATFCLMFRLCIVRPVACFRTVSNAGPADSRALRRVDVALEEVNLS